MQTGPITWLRRLSIDVLPPGVCLTRLTSSKFSRDVFWATILNGSERIIAAIQTVLVARALGITEYGFYGFLLGTIGFVASIAGLQLGLTSAVYVSRYRKSDPAKVAVIIQFVSRYSFAVCCLIALSTLPFSANISSWLLASDQWTLPIALGCVLAGVSLLCGMQEGILQGFEDFRSIAMVRIALSILTLATLYPASVVFGFPGTMAVICFGSVIQFAALFILVGRHKHAHGIPQIGSGLRFVDVIYGFSLPSMLVSFLAGATIWFGTFVLSRQAGGFEALAIANTAMQWRGPILLFATSVGNVAVPRFSQYEYESNEIGAARLEKKILWIMGFIAIAVSSVLIALSRPLLATYGPGFVEGRLVFSILIASAIPQVLVNVYMNNLVGRGKLWQVFGMHIPVSVLQLACYFVLIPQYGLTGFAATVFGSTISFLLYVVIATRRRVRESSFSALNPAVIRE